MTDPIEAALRVYLGDDGWRELRRAEQSSPGTIMAARCDMQRAMTAADEVRKANAGERAGS